MLRFGRRSRRRRSWSKKNTRQGGKKTPKNRGSLVCFNVDWKEEKTKRRMRKIEVHKNSGDPTLCISFLPYPTQKFDLKHYVYRIQLDERLDQALKFGYSVKSRYCSYVIVKSQIATEPQLVEPQRTASWSSASFHIQSVARDSSQFHT